MARNKENVATPSGAWSLMEEYRDLPRDLRGGVVKLQKLGQKHLFKAEREGLRDYRRRVQVLTFDPYYWSSCDHLGGQPFTAPIKFSDNTPKELTDVWANDVDGSRRNFRSIAYTSCTSSVGLGLEFLFVIWDPDDQRPYIMVIPGANVLDPWEEGAPVRVLMSETEPDPDKPWLKRTADQVWVLYDGITGASGDDSYARWEVYERIDRFDPKSPWKDKPEPVDPTSKNLFKPQTQIPLFPLYSGGTGPLDLLPWICLPPMHDVAVKNRSHMNKRSDLDWGLHIANIPQRCASGITENEARSLSTVSYQGLWWMEAPNGKFYFCEHSGLAFGVTATDLSNLGREMQVFGLSPMVSALDAQTATATGRLVDLSRATTIAQAWTLGWQDSWQQAWRAAARYRQVPDTFSLEFFSSFGPRERDLERASIVQQDYLQGNLQPEDYFPEMKRLGAYTDTFDPEAAAARVKKANEDSQKLAQALADKASGRSGESGSPQAPGATEPKSPFQSAP